MKDNSTSGKNTFIDVINPKPNDIVFVYDVQASESGALSILEDFHSQVRNYYDKTVKWIFVISTPHLEPADNIVVLSYPWVKKSWFHRLKFEYVDVRRLIKKYKPMHLFSLQNKGIENFSDHQVVYLHMSLYLSDHKFSMKTDGKKLWIYQNIIGKIVLNSLKTVDTVIVQTKWMKEALVRKIQVDINKVVVQHPYICLDAIEPFQEKHKNYRNFFYPATAFPYKNHWTLIKAIKIAQDKGMNDYNLVLTINKDDNDLARALFDYSKKEKLSIDFIGPITRKMVYEKYAESVLIFPSYMESFGLPLLEARETGTPIIASDTPFSHEILDGYQKAVFFPELDKNTLSRCILSMYFNYGNIVEDINL